MVTPESDFLVLELLKHDAGCIYITLYIIYYILVPLRRNEIVTGTAPCVPLPLAVTAASFASCASYTHF